MDRIFLATMVSAVLLLIVAADLMVNGLGRQQAEVDVASMMPASVEGLSNRCDVTRCGQSASLDARAEHFGPLRTSAHRVSHNGQRDPDRLSSALVGGAEPPSAPRD